MSITLSWEGSTDNTGIKNYLIFFEDDTVEISGNTTSHQLTNLTLNTNYAFTVKAVDLGGNLSTASNESAANTYVSGVYYRHSTGGWSDLDQIDWSIAEYEGKLNNITLSPRTQEDYFNFEFDGYLYINTPGTYQFRTSSDDGSRLALNGMVIVENDGLHGDVTVTSADQTLSSGPQMINVKYFEYGGGQTLTVRYRGPDTGNNWITVPDNAWKSGNPPAARASSPIPAMAEPLTAKVYPNPVSSGESLTISTHGNGDEVVHVSLRNMMGESYFEKTYKGDELSTETLLTPKKHLSKGVYVLVVRKGKRVLQERVVVKE
jgi:hypothetical protein